MDGKCSRNKVKQEYGEVTLNNSVDSQRFATSVLECPTFYLSGSGG
jgi:hypothetical protein